MSAGVWVQAPGGGSIGAHVRNENCPVAGCHPVVVIDPEDREQVTQFAELYDAAMSRLFPEFHGAAISIEDDDAIMQAALREFADPKPPKPAEPTAWMAVVEDANGAHWARMVAGDGPSYVWGRKGNVSGPWLRYSEIAAVRVLSEGVS